MNKTEEICVRPNIAKPLLSRIGPHNASLIRIVLAEYSAAAEELSQLAPHATHPPITLSFVHTLLSSFNISMAQLRVFAISIIPYGFDQATRDLMKLQAKTIMGMMPLRVKWLDAKNEPEQLEKVIEGICARENGWEKADYYEDVDSKIGLRWASPFSGRLWIKYGAE
ncbi:hypothetical protein BU26DRAFT_512859 [Trematosphaeria pertusa]|uniref:Uncharacterized protein n=1 Tax=Trematosphaeria pertusa TaxID=390896 RepID=A0A6A6J0S4_9PLEO|nr:uncharacterized protein BU26DRAFT_512859 [Trematosphaeria pertusa]KAF2255917.1 hypothetical protein BU26DRAFT_512859 [Trematosphaeria pertusa]